MILLSSEWEAFLRCQLPECSDLCSTGFLHNMSLVRLAKDNRISCERFPTELHAVIAPSQWRLLLQCAHKVSGIASDQNSLHSIQDSR